MDTPALRTARFDAKDNLTEADAIRAMVERAIFEEYAPAGVLINDKYEILHFVGKTDGFLMQPSGKPSFNVLNMAREDLKAPLLTALHKAVREKANAFLKNIRIAHNGAFRIVDLSVKHIRPGFLLVIFEDKTPEEAVAKKPSSPLETKKPDRDVQHLEQELQSTREYLQATIEELETSNEELKSTNEELQSVNEAPRTKSWRHPRKSCNPPMRNWPR